MEELLKEILDSLKTRQKGVEYRYYDYDKKEYTEGRCRPDRGKGTIAYTVRRIDLLQDKLKELKKDLKSGKYDFKGKVI